MYKVTLQKTETHEFDSNDFRQTLKTWTDRGYTVADVEVEDENKGAFLYFCEDCGLPIFENDDYQQDAEGIYWHTACCDCTEESTSWMCEYGVNGCVPGQCKVCEYGTEAIAKKREEEKLFNFLHIGRSPRA